MTSIYWSFLCSEMDLNEYVKRRLLFLGMFFPSYLKISTPAVSLQRRDIFCAHLGNLHAPNHILIHGTIHAREWLNSLVLLEMISNICKQLHADSDSNYHDLLNRSCFHIIPILNPDGVHMCFQDKKYKRYKANGRGVDLNRNFPYGWEMLPDTKPGSQFYRGETPFSEPETKLIRQLIKQYSPCAVVSYHESGEQIFTLQKSRLTNCLENVTGYAQHILLVPEGGCSDWCSHSLKIDAATVETGIGRAPLSGLQAGRIYRQQKEVIAAIAKLYYNS